MPGSEDPFSAFIRVLRECLFFLVKNIYLTIANIICFLLLLCTFLLPWRLLGFCLHSSRYKTNCFESMDQFRATACTHVFISVSDLMGMPFYLLGLMMPTRCDISLRGIIAACMEKTQGLSEHCNWEVRTILFRNAFGGIIDLIGFACFVTAVIIPWPTTVIKKLSLEFSKYREGRKTIPRQHLNNPLHENNIRRKSRQHLQFSCSVLCVAILVRSIIEICAFPLFVCSLIVPTRTVPALRYFSNIFYIRMSSSSDWKIEEDEDMYFFGNMLVFTATSVADLITLPAVIICIVIAPLRLQKMIHRGRDIVGRNVVAAALWPCRSDIIEGRDTSRDWAIIATKTESGARITIRYHYHWNSELRQMIWVQAMFCIVDLLLMPFVLLACFGIVHTVRSLYCLLISILYIFFFIEMLFPLLQYMSILYIYISI